MGRRDRELFQNIEIETVAAEGKSLAHVNGKVIFVPFTVPGDIVDIQVKIKRKGYMEGFVTNMIKPSPDRIEPFCSHFGVCGGCKWQSLAYSTQLRFKQQQVTDQLTRIGHLKLPEITPILGSESEQYYRNKLEFTFSSKRWIESLTEAENLPAEQRTGLGFHIAGLFDKVLDINHCYLQPSPSNEIRLFVKEFAIKNGLTFFDLREQTGFLRTMVVRTTSTGEVMVIMVFANENIEEREGLLNALRDNFPAITSLNWVINGKKNDSIADLECYNYSGMPYITEKMEDLSFRIGPKSFYQTNSQQAYRLYSIVRDFADLKGSETLYDLYTGTGTIALFLAHSVAKVVGIEYVAEAIEDAKINAAENKIQNCSFFAGDMRDMLSSEFIEQNGKPDVVVLDPPRAGIHPDVAKVLAEAAPEKIVYVSCNPATQARDIALLGDNYEIKRVQPVDMFPHTHHLENVVLLVKKG
ncbi:MAG: 23S rRNA (uracil-5-)-methyltransferase RumA [Bacteroidetes bacterium GWE2_39_28]|nr:MAG: 23S rRNA (uracil-5-)-methyltransferase RumA [Bacteroidetes bacterium GWE2_39_28]OFY14070.1 MAG: 23S rRNA (uracil-5-)-methyltransferase RumA [Bacteroidetes bacterium GWF2_39_10]OFZ10790.1 MAG: 23S rRNA (uracil-5-)-methyltransferase RumA [Bacteroidetes bacterium RIFOXYC2_FULL_39_11]HCT94009.1 23S rRNA (uracil(1939)-C(5))-methyltransferase RlmD [Rikenellaceae bacterium]